MNQKGYKHLTHNARLVIERMLLNGFSKKEIALAIGCCVRIIYYEISRAKYVHTDCESVEEERYNPDEAQRKYRQHLKEKGVPSKPKSDLKLCKYIEHMICEQKYSPAAIIKNLKSIDSFSVKIKSHTTNI